MPVGDDVEVAVASLQTRVLGLEQGVDRVANVVGELGKKIDSAQRTPWTVIWSALGVTITFVGLFVMLLNKPIESSLESLGTRLRDMREQLATQSESNEREIIKLRESTVSRDDLSTRLEAERRIANELRSFTEERSKRNAERIERLLAESVTKANLTDKLAALDKALDIWRSMKNQTDAGRMDRLQQQIDEVRTRIATFATPQDTMGALRERLTELERFVREVTLRAQGKAPTP